VTEEAWRLGAVETAAAIRAGKLTCVEAVQSAVDRMRAVNPAVNAVTLDLSEQALAQARAYDEIAASDVDTGPLHGVPVTIKENVDQKGLPNPNGIPAFESIIAPDDSPVVANLKKAGAIVIGRTNTPEFSYRWFTDNPLRGQTLNPWDHGITPGGSSGGAAASVALGIGTIGHGNDLGGSLRYPAYACGVATIRPSLGRVAAYNPSAREERPLGLQMMSVQGPIARSVRDVRLGLEVMAQRDPRDPWWVPAPLAGPREPGPIRVAVSKTPGNLPCDPAVAAAVDRAAGHLADAGYAVEAVDPPDMEEVAECWRRILFTDTRVMMEPAIREHGSADINKTYDGFLTRVNYPDFDAYVREISSRTRIWRDWAMFMEDYPLVLMPVSSVPPFPQNEDLKGGERYSRMVDEQAVLYGINLLGLPSAAVPTGLHDGVPMGVQLVGRRFREDQCLDAAQAIENAVGILSEQLWQRG
jgi:amidase